MDQNNINNELNNQNNNELNIQPTQQPIEQTNAVQPMQQPIEQTTSAQPVESIQTNIVPPVESVQPVEQIQPVQSVDQVQSVQPVDQVQPQTIQESVQTNEPLNQTSINNQQPIQNVVNNNQFSYQNNYQPKKKVPVLLIIIIIILGGYLGFRLYLSLSFTKLTLDVRDSALQNTVIDETNKVFTAAQNEYLNITVLGKSDNLHKLDVVSTSGISYTCYTFGIDDLNLTSLNTSNGNYATVLICQNSLDKNANQNVIVAYANSNNYIDGYINYTKTGLSKDNIKKGTKPKDVVYITSSTSESDYEKIKNSVSSLLD